jgi:hypothetical protein
VAFFPLRLVDKLYVVSITGGADPAGLIRWIVPHAKRYLGAVGTNHGPGSLLVVYQPPRARSRQLVPLALVTMHSQTSGVKSIQAGDNYTR